MIKSIRLQNFQSHESTLLEFDPGVNVIVGDSDSGKTAVLRALSWVLTNRPTGEAFRRYGTSETRVEVETIEGSVERLRADNGNLYWVGVERLAAIGTSVPESVLKLLKMDAEVNIQRQLDAPFLLSCSPGEVAQRLNASVGLDEIDVGLANVARRVRQYQSAFSEIDKRCKELSEQVASFAYLIEMEQDLQLVEKELERQLVLGAQEASLKVLQQGIEDAVRVLAELPPVDELFLLVSEAQKALGERELKRMKVENLSDSISEAVSVTEALRSIPDVLRLLTMCEETFSAIQRWSEQRLVHAGLAAFTSDAIDTQADLLVASKELLQHEGLFHKTMPTTCPLCGRRGRKS